MTPMRDGKNDFHQPPLAFVRVDRPQAVDTDGLVRQRHQDQNGRADHQR